MSKAALSVRPVAVRRARLRARVFIRDRGVCALCGADTEKLHQQLLALRAETPGHRAKSQAYVALLKAYDIPSSLKLWEADHTVPLSEGGDDDISNTRTLCTVGNRCHQRVTAELAGRRARQPRSR